MIIFKHVQLEFYTIKYKMRMFINFLFSAANSACRIWLSSFVSLKIQLTECKRTMSPRCVQIVRSQLVYLFTKRDIFNIQDMMVIIIHEGHFTSILAFIQTKIQKYFLVDSWSFFNTFIRLLWRLLIPILQ